MIDLATEVVEFRKDALKIASDLDDNGLRLNTAKIEAAAELAKAKADLFTAKLSHRLVLVNLAKLSGSYLCSGKVTNAIRLPGLSAPRVRIRMKGEGVHRPSQAHELAGAPVSPAANVAKPLLRKTPWKIYRLNA